MLDVYKDFYKLTDDPFRLSPDHRFSFEHPSYAQAKAYLEYAIFQGEGFITVTGLPGTGKTTLISEILTEVDESHIRVATITSTQLDARDFLHMVAASFGLQFGEENKVTLLRALAHFLIQQKQKGLRSVLIVDEAQGLSASALEELRLLANLQHRHSLVLQVCLVGQESLRDVIGSPEMEHLRQRQIASAHLNPLDLDETIAYIEHRLRFAAWQGDPAFTEAALRRIYQSSGGIPRRINLICNRMFLYGGLDKKHELGGEDAERMIDELREEMLLAPDEAVETIGADAPGHENDNVDRRLPRGEMLATNEAHSPPRPMQHPVERPAAVIEDFPDWPVDSGSPETTSHAQSDETTAQPPPAQAPAVTGRVAASMPAENASQVLRREVTAQSPQAQARAVTGDASLPFPEKTPDKPKGRRFKIMVKMTIALLLAAGLTFMLMTAMQQNRFVLVKNAQNNGEVVRREASPAVNPPRTTILPETWIKQVPVESKPEVEQLPGKPTPNRHASRDDNAAPAILIPEAETRKEVVGSGTAAPELAMQAAVVKKADTVAKQKPALVKKADTVAKQKPALVKKANAVAKQKPAVVKKADAVAKQKPAVVKKAGTVAKQKPAVVKNANTVAKQKPAVVKKANAVAKQKPAVVKNANTVAKQKPAVVKNANTVAKQKPAVVKKANAVAKQKPDVVKNANTVAKQKPAVVKKANAVAKQKPAVVKKADTVAKQKPAVVKKADTVAEPQAAIKAKHLPLKKQADQRVERLIKTPVQSLPTVKKPAAPARRKTRVVAATANPLPSSTRLTTPAFAAHEIKSALLAGRWISNGQPASVLPSEVTFCRRDQQVINCWSVPQNSDSGDGKVAFKVEATLSDFADTGNFQLLDKRLVKSIDAGATNNEPWQVTERKLICTMVKTDKVSCQDRRGNTSEYHLSVLSR